MQPSLLLLLSDLLPPFQQLMWEHKHSQVIQFSLLLVVGKSTMSSASPETPLLLVLTHTPSTTGLNGQPQTL